MDPRARVRVDVTETTPPAGAAPLASSVYINPDPTAPEIESPEIESPEIESVEVYTPEIESASVHTMLAPEIESPEIESPEIESPEIESPEIESNSYQTPEIESPEIESPEIESPEIESPEIESPEIESAPITDVTWPLQNVGNTVAGYQVRPLVNATPEELARYHFRLIISRVVKAPADKDGCTPAVGITNRVAVNITDAGRLVDPRITALDPSEAQNATI